MPEQGAGPIGEEPAPTTRRLVLASTSERRRELLARLGVPFARLDPAVEEPEPAPGAEARAYALEMARLKADAATALLLAPDERDLAHESLAPAELVDVLTSDTTVALDNEILGKPLDRADALRILGALSDSRHRVISSIVLRTLDLRRRMVLDTAEAADETHIQFRKLTPPEILAYVDSGESFGKAGAYAVQEQGGGFVERIDGHFTTVVGLPLHLVARWLAARGYSVPGPEELARLERRPAR